MVKRTHMRFDDPKEDKWVNYDKQYSDDELADEHNQWVKASKDLLNEVSEN